MKISAALFTKWLSFGLIKLFPALLIDIFFTHVHCVCVCIRVESVHVRKCSYVSVGGWYLFQRQYFLVLIHSVTVSLRFSSVADWRTRAHSILICQDVSSSGQERRGRGKQEAGAKSGWKERDGTQQSIMACPIVRAYTHTRMSTCTTKTLIKPASQSISQCPLEGLNFCPLYPHRHLNTAHWGAQRGHWQRSASYSHSSTLIPRPHGSWMVRRT